MNHCELSLALCLITAFLACFKSAFISLQEKERKNTTSWVKFSVVKWIMFFGHWSYFLSIILILIFAEFSTFLCTYEVFYTLLSYKIMNVWNMIITFILKPLLYSLFCFSRMVMVTFFKSNIWNRIIFKWGYIINVIIIKYYKIFNSNNLCNVKFKKNTLQRMFMLWEQIIRSEV